MSRPAGSSIAVWIDREKDSGDGLWSLYCADVFMYVDGVLYAHKGDNQPLGNEKLPASLAELIGEMVILAAEHEEAVIEAVSAIYPHNIVFLEYVQAVDGQVTALWNDVTKEFDLVP